MKSAKNILVIGELNVDILLNGIDGFPEMGAEILADTMHVVLGSSSAIFASNISSLGFNVAFNGAVGNDAFGSKVLEALRLNKVDTQHIRAKKDQNTGATIVMNYDQDRANITYCGAMDAFSINDIPWTSLKNYQHVHISNFFIQKLIRNNIGEILEKIKTAGLSISLDLQWDVKELWDFDYKNLLQYVDVFLPSESELLKLTNTTHVNDAIESVRPYINTMALKRGTKGSVGVCDGQQIVSEAYQIDSFIDAIGAGDSFNAGFIYEHLNGGTLHECLAHGNLIGAISTTGVGGTSAFKDKQILTKMIHNMRTAALKIQE